MRFASDILWSLKNDRKGGHFRGPIISGNTNDRFPLIASASQTSDTKSMLQKSLNTPVKLQPV